MASRRLPRLLSFSSKSSLIMATIICIPFLTFYWLSLGCFLPETLTASYANWVNALSIILYLPFAFFAYTLFGNFYIYMLVMVISLTAAIISIIKNRPNKLHLSWSIMLVCSIIVFPLLFRYQPALAAAPGYEMQLITDPGFVKGIVKASQNLVEITPCTYEYLAGIQIIGSIISKRVIQKQKLGNILHANQIVTHRHCFKNRSILIQFLKIRY